MVEDRAVSRIDALREIRESAADSVATWPSWMRENIVDRREHQSPETLGPENLTRAQERLFLKLFDHGAIRFEDSRMNLHEAHPEAPLSPVYFDLRLIRRLPDLKRTALGVYRELIDPLQFDLLADVPTGATPVVSSLSEIVGKGMITPRIDEKTHGSGAKVDGLLPTDRGKTALLIDDVTSSGASGVAAITILNANGINVEDFVCLVDRQQGASGLLMQQGIILHRAGTMQQALDLYLRVGRINEDKYGQVQQGIKDLNDYLGV